MPWAVLVLVDSAVEMQATRNVREEELLAREQQERRSLIARLCDEGLKINLG